MVLVLTAFDSTGFLWVVRAVCDPVSIAKTVKTETPETHELKTIFQREQEELLTLSDPVRIAATTRTTRLVPPRVVRPGPETRPRWGDLAIGGSILAFLDRCGRHLLSPILSVTSVLPTPLTGVLQCRRLVMSDWPVICPLPVLV